MLSISVSHLDRLYRERDSNGFPERAADGRTWRRQDIAKYELPREQARRSARDSVDRSGAPDELVGKAEAARVLGYSTANALPSRMLERADEQSTGPKGRYRRK
ncbi:hypothetical protein ACIBTZ_33660 [Micromonospora sp. NPDC049460]|uniref:hypothetical protein n=1 Tax=Micromonospora sp. NPDC049460 TaxID=3364272 RepID=UPI00379B7D4E